MLRDKIEVFIIATLIFIIIGFVIVFSLAVWNDCRESGNSIIFCLALASG